MTFRFDRKQKYLLQSVLAFAFIYLIQVVFITKVWVSVVLSIIFILAFSLFSHYPNLNIKNTFYSVILPFQLFLGTILFINYYPSLSFIFKVGVIFGFACMYYIISLVDNIFLVVQDRKEAIPLLRVASAWAQILSVVIAVPLFASFFKSNTDVFFQSFFVGISAILFCAYIFWGISFDTDYRRPEVGERVMLFLLMFFFAFSSNLGVSFMPAQTFLRGLFVSSVLMLGLTYVSSHLRNNVDKKIITQLFLICSIFLVILFLFL